MDFASIVNLLIPLDKQVLDFQCSAFRDSVAGRRAMFWRPRFHFPKRALSPPELRGFSPPLTASPSITKNNHLGENGPR
jgi:hypothetical protein